MSALTIDIPAEEFHERVVAEAAGQMLRRYVRDEDGDECAMPSELARRIEKTVVGTIEQQARDAAPNVAEEILARGVRRTNNWGDATGDLVPLSTIVAEEVLKHLRTDSSGRGGESALRAMLNQEVQKVVRAELQEALDEAKAKVVAAVKDEATNALAKAIDDMLPAVKF